MFTCAFEFDGNFGFSFAFARFHAFAAFHTFTGNRVFVKGCRVKNRLRTRLKFRVRDQLLSVIFCTATFVVLLGAVIDANRNLNAIRTMAMYHAALLIDVLALDFARLASGEDSARLQSDLHQRFESFRELAELTLYRLDGTAVYSYRNPRFLGSEEESRSNNLLRVKRELRLRDVVIGYVDATVPAAHLRDAIMQYQKYLFGLVIFLLAVSVAVAMLTQGFFTKPLHQIVAFLRDVKAQRLFQQRMIVGRQDEFGDVMYGVNNLLAEVEDSQAALEHRNAQLTSVLEQLQEREKQLVAEHQEKELAWQGRALAEHASQEKSAFLAHMSHELRTPLNAVIGYSEMIEEEFSATLNPTILQDLHHIRTAAFHLLTLINDVLDVSKIEAGKMRLDLQTFDIGDLISETLVMAKPLSQRRNNQIDAHIEVNGTAMTSDPVRVRQILFNLLSNACKFTENGTITLRAYARDGLNGAGIEFKITDTGVGMTKSDLERLFQPFVQVGSAKRVGTYQGSGLGLALCRYLSDIMGGTITAASTYGCGSEFQCWLPLDVEAASRLIGERQTS